MEDTNQDVEQGAQVDDTAQVSDGSQDDTHDTTVVQAPTALEVASAVVDEMQPMMRSESDWLAQAIITNLSGRMDALEASVGSAISGIESAAQTEQLTTLSTDQALAYLPTDAPTFASTFFTPLLWGILAGFICWVIGYLWESFQALLGLAKPSGR